MVQIVQGRKIVSKKEVVSNFCATKMAGKATNQTCQKLLSAHETFCCDYSICMENAQNKTAILENEACSFLNTANIQGSLPYHSAPNLLQALKTIRNESSTNLPNVSREFTTTSDQKQIFRVKIQSTYHSNLLEGNIIVARSKKEVSGNEICCSRHSNSLESNIIVARSKKELSGNEICCSRHSNSLESNIVVPRNKKEVSGNEICCSRHSNSLESNIVVPRNKK